MNNNEQLNVIFVDDEPEVTELLSFALRKEPYQIRTALSGAEALEKCKERPADILITDIRMPGIDGLELSREVLKLYPDIQIIVISAHGDISIAVEAMKLGAVDFLQKPVDHNVLRLAIESSADKWRLRNELRLANDELNKTNIALEDEIEERQRIQTALEDEKERLAVTLRSVGDGVITTDLDGKIVLLNKVAEKLTGWQSNEAAGKPLSEVFYIINEKTRQVCDNPVQKVIETGLIVGLANHTGLIARDGSEKSIADSAAPIRDRESRTIGVVLVFRDVTMENRINQELTKTRKLESVGILAGGIAHDFNNILMGIIGNINLAKLNLSPDHKSHNFLDIAEKASERASRLTKQLLTFSKGGDPVKETTSVVELVKDSSSFVLTGSNVTCRVDSHTKLWAAKIDKGQISQVIQNIVINAKQAMPEGGTIHILCDNFNKTGKHKELSPLTNGDYVEISIQDKGIGIHHEQIENIFDPYFSTKQEGSGLGLAITHSIIKKHGGYIACESIIGDGTCFRIYLPATLEKVELTNISETDTGGEGTIMVMDDEEVVRRVSKAMLESLGYEVILAKDGTQALDLYKQAMKTLKPIDIVIMDLTIPGGMGGQEAVVKLLELDPQAKAIVSSGYSNDPVMANYNDYGYKGMIDKPYLRDKLHKELQRVLSVCP